MNYAPKTHHPSKKLLNSHQSCATDSLTGFVSWNPGLVSLMGFANVVLRRDWQSRAKEGKVAVVTGGGSGHEPCFAGFVGEGMATAAIHGDIFAAPSSKSILATIVALGRNGQAGVLIIFNNYTGDRLNFGIAAEKARSQGVKVEIVINSDDCALANGARPNCRRGLSGLILLLKMVGLMSDSGEDLEKLAAYARQTVPQIATMGVAWSPCSLPGGGPLFELGHNEMEIGLGMHGEAGIKRIQMLNTKDTVSMLLDHMTNKEIIPPFINIKKGDRLVVLLNNMGSTSDIEMNIFAREVLQQLSKLLEVSIDRMYVGRYVTSQEMAGISLTIMITDDFRNQCLDSKTTALSWVVPVTTGDTESAPLPWRANSDGDDNEIVDDQHSDSLNDDNKVASGPVFSEDGHRILMKALTSIANALVANNSLLNAWDSACGDGDCGNTFAAGARGVFKIVHNGSLTKVRNVCQVVDMLAEVVEDTMGGTSGGLYSLFLTSVSQEISTGDLLTSRLCTRAMRKGIDAIIRYGGAEPGFRTMIDPLNASCVFLETQVDNLKTLVLWQQAVKVAEQEMKRTKDMLAKVGRASYVSEDTLVLPDPGAKAFCIWLGAVVNVLTDNKKFL